MRVQYVRGTALRTLFYLLSSEPWGRVRDRHLMDEEMEAESGAISWPWEDLRLAFKDKTVTAMPVLFPLYQRSQPTRVQVLPLLLTH